MKIRPVMFQWNGEAMVPQPRFMPLCDKQFVVHEEYPLLPIEPRSMKSHSHFFAALHEAWNNLSEADSKRFPTEEHLRHWALIQCGFCQEAALPCEKSSVAKNVAALIRTRDPYAVIIVKGDVVKVLTAKSQSLAAMGAEEFKDSKEKILDLVATMARTTRKELAKEATKHAPPEPEPKPKPKTAPAAAPAPLPANRPTTAPAYFAYARSWILGSTDMELAWLRWGDERDLRDQLRVSIPNRRELKGLLARQFEEAEAAR
jgi:hypothetical protein